MTIRWREILAGTSGLLLLAGCHMQPYGPGYYNYGPTYGPSYSTPPGYMTPGPVYTPQNLSPTPITPGTGSPTPISPTPNQNTPTWRPDSTPSNNLQDAPPYRPNNTNSNGVVPDPLDLDPGFGAPPGAAATVPRAVPLTDAPPFQPVETASGTAQPPGRFPADDPDPFEAPTQVTPAALKPVGISTTASSAPAPYGHDAQQYTWLRGIVDYDSDSKTWSIIYNLTPDVGDKFGGSFIFAPHPQLQNLQPGAQVLVKGRVDPGRTDGRNKPLYEISQLVPLPPRDAGP